ncbi:MAG TPA: tetratricopeptide repeat protein [Vitreimonas sp.]|uniref:tetratricopeptide repeat protein n=1 Tax=Vitreimonas sp. TaxID=3069702 RepID=UPI002D26378A|nr:tetratricopeptide repeat protein [Vitreimonas sp.]HYD86465.1 tetratricopeptide repeat protein [Vitreimonas sp.]
MRWQAILAASIAAAAGVTGAAYARQPESALQQAALTEERVPNEALRRTSPPNAAADRTYEGPEQALIEADIDYLVREGRRAIARGENTALWTAIVFADDLASGRNAEARRTLEAAPGGLSGGIADMLEPFLLAAEGRADRGVERIDAGQDNLPAPLPEVARGLVFESAGRLEEAAAVYAAMVERLDTTPPGEAEPRTPEEFERTLNAARVTNSVYRAALVHHRLGRTEEARRYYGIYREFMPRSADVIANLARLEAGQPPFEPALDAKSATGRWMLFVSEYLTQQEMLQALMAQQDPTGGLASASGTALLQVGVLLAPDANDWRLYAAQQVLEAGGAEGAERILAMVPESSIYAPDAEIVRADIALERRNDEAAMAAAQRALACAGDRWSIIASAGDIYRRAGHADRAIPAFDRALGMVSDPKDRADVLGWRAYAHRFAGNISAASADARAALEIDPSVDTRFLYVSILMDDPQGWADGIRVARGLFAEQPDSVLRLNALGYALIQRPEGLEEGYRLLWRGFNNGQQDYAVIDSLGWAYYQYGHFDQARALIERSNDLSAHEPNAEVLDHLGDVYWRLNRRDDARTQWRAALEARPDALRRRDLEQKLQRGLTTPAPRQRELPQVSLPEGPTQRDEL